MSVSMVGKDGQQVLQMFWLGWWNKIEIPDLQGFQTWNGIPGTAPMQLVGLVSSQAIPLLY